MACSIGAGSAVTRHSMPKPARAGQRKVQLVAVLARKAGLRGVHVAGLLLLGGAGSGGGYGGGPKCSAIVAGDAGR